MKHTFFFALKFYQPLFQIVFFCIFAAMENLLLILFYILTPLLILYLCSKFEFLSKIGSIIIAYAVGLLLAFSNIIPEECREIQQTMTDIAIPLAIPLLLFTLDIRRWFKIAAPAFISMLIGLVAVVIMVFVGYQLFGKDVENGWKVGGMLIGVYSGGTPNLASIKAALDINPEIYIITHTYDMIISAVYIFFLITIGQRTFQIVLRKFIFNPENKKTSENHNSRENLDFLEKKQRIPLLKVFSIAFLIFIAGVVISRITPQDYSMLAAILFITTAGIAISFFPAVNKVKSSFDLGMYFIIVFSLIVASMVDLQSLMNVTPGILYFVSLTVFGSLVLHVIGSYVFKIDADTMIITSTALICSPPFVPVVAGAIRNREIILSGLTVGIIGYAAGNYLGVFVAFMLK